MKTCPYCGNNRFYAIQCARGSLDVIVDGDNNWLENHGSDFDALSNFNFKDPEGPYRCVRCRSSWDRLSDIPDEFPYTVQFDNTIYGPFRNRAEAQKFVELKTPAKVTPVIFPLFAPPNDWNIPF